MKIIKTFDQWCNHALKLLKNSEYCYIASFNLNFKEESNDKVYNILQQASQMKHKVLIGISTLQCKPDCEHCKINNSTKYYNVDRLNSITKNYRIVQELHMKTFITSNGIIVGGMNITGSGWTDRAFVYNDLSTIKYLKSDFKKVYKTAKSYILPEFIDPKVYFTFGKYKGEKIEDIKQLNPGYIKWLAENTSHQL